MGPTLIIWCTAGVSGMVAPAIARCRGLQTPAQMTTYSAWMSPRSVLNAGDLAVLHDHVVDSVLGKTDSAPCSTAYSRMMVPARSESTTPTLGV
jgi:hypothetical protein